MRNWLLLLAFVVLPVLGCSKDESSKGTPMPPSKELKSKNSKGLQVIDEAPPPPQQKKS